MKKIKSKYTVLRPVVISIMALFIGQSCTKTTHEQLLRPYRTIESFAIAGYGDMDSITAVISGDSIKVYWNPDVESPATIRPAITISDGATIAPASGEEVSFSENTVYTVTAEDGTAKTYTLKPVFNETIPLQISAIHNSTSTGGYVTITGLYFLPSHADKSDIEVYAQRITDGFEFDLSVDTATLTDRMIVGYRPEFTAEQDTGWHRINVRIGNYTSNSLQIWIPPVFTNNLTTTWDFASSGQPVYPDETLTLKYEITGIAAKYLTLSSSPTVRIAVSSPTNTNTSITLVATDVTNEDGVLTFKLPASTTSYYGYYINYITVSAGYKSTSTASAGYTLSYTLENTATIITQRP